MSNKILCTIDFSGTSGHALKFAASLARDLHSHLTVLYAYRLTRVKNNGVFELRKEMEEEAAFNFAKLEKEILKDMGISYDFKTEVGFVSDRVEAHTKKNPIGLLVIDKNMSVESKESFDELVENTQVPMVIVP